MRFRASCDTIAVETNADTKTMSAEVVALIGVGVAVLTVSVSLAALILKGIGAGRAETVALRVEMRRDMADLRTEMRADMADLRADMADLRDRMARLEGLFEGFTRQGTQVNAPAVAT